MHLHMDDLRQKRQRPPWRQLTSSLPNLGANDAVTLKIAARFIVHHLNPSTDERKSVVADVRIRLKKANEKGTLGGGDRAVLFGELIRWARANLAWRESLRNFSALDGARSSAVSAHLKSRSAGHAIPVLREDLEDALGAAHALIREQGETIEVKEAELEQLRPLGRKRDATRVKLIEAGKRGGRGNIR